MESFVLFTLSLVLSFWLLDWFPFSPSIFEKEIDAM